MEQVLLDQITALRAQLHACAEVAGREVVTKHTLLTFLREHTSLELHELAGGFYAAHREPEGTKPTVALRADYDALLMPDASGATRWRDLLGEVWTGCFAVSSSCEDPAAALRWVDALYGEDGALLAYAGVEGEDYVWNGAGTWSFKLTGSRTINDVRANVLMYTGAAMPGLYPSDFISKVASPVDQHVFEQNERVHAVSEQVVPAHALSLERQQRANELTVVLGGLVDRGVARFATGEIELNDETYAAWLSELKAAGSDELVAMYAEN